MRDRRRCLPTGVTTRRDREFQRGQKSFARQTLCTEFALCERLSPTRALGDWRDRARQSLSVLCVAGLLRRPRHCAKIECARPRVRLRALRCRRRPRALARLRRVLKTEFWETAWDWPQSLGLRRAKSRWSNGSFARA